MPNYTALDHDGTAGVTTLTAQLASGTTTNFTVTDATGFPLGGGAGNFYIAISPTEDLDNPSAITERILCSSRSGNVITIASSGRGADGTTAATHPAGSKVLHVFSADEAAEANDAVVQTIGKVTTAGDMLVASGTGTFSRLAKGTDGHVLRMASGSVGWGTLPADSVGSSQIAADAVGASEIATGAVGNAELADDAVTAAKIAANAVDSSEIAADAVGSSEIAAGAVGTTELADSAVTDAKILDGTITNAKLATPPSGGVDLNALTTDSTIAVSDYIPFVDVSGSNSSDKALITSLLGLIMPVGHVYLGYTSTSPTLLFGFGTWTAIAEGEAIVGKASSGTFGSVGSIGAAGAETVTLTEAQMPAHTHVGEGTGANFAAAAGGFNVRQNQTTPNTSSKGSSQAHNNIQPSFVVYAWRRTA